MTSTSHTPIHDPASKTAGIRPTSGRAKRSTNGSRRTITPTTSPAPEDRSTWMSNPEAEPTTPVPHEDLASVAALAADLRAQLARNAVALVDTRSHAPGTHETFLNTLAHSLGHPIRVFDNHPYWKPIGVDTTRPTDRSGGTGDQPLHMDFVNAQQPPHIIVLHCIRPDPRKGGHSRFADFRQAVAQLTPSSLEALTEPVFADGQVRNLHHVGNDINPFAILNTNDTVPYRYTGNLLNSEVPPAQRAALAELAAILDRLEQRVRLEAGQTLFIDNRYAVHSRGHLGQNQEELSSEQRRLLVQGFVQLEGVK